MKRFILTAALAMGLSGTVAGCAEDTPEIFIVANQVFADGCEVPSAGAGTAANQVFRTRGVLDLFVTDFYVAIPRVENTLVESESAGFNTTGGEGDGLAGTDWEANHILLRRAVIQFDAPEALGVPLPREITVEVSGAIAPGGAATIEMQAITPSIGATLANSRLLREARTSLTIDLRIKFFGVTAAGREVDSNEFIYPVELCYGCLLSIPPTAIDPDYAIQPNCRNTDFEDDVDFDTLCFEGQDETVDCRNVCPIVTAIPNGDPEGICEPSI